MLPLITESLLVYYINSQCCRRGGTREYGFPIWKNAGGCHGKHSQECEPLMVTKPTLNVCCQHWLRHTCVNAQALTHITAQHHTTPPADFEKCNYPYLSMTLKAHRLLCLPMTTHGFLMSVVRSNNCCERLLHQHSDHLNANQSWIPAYLTGKHNLLFRVDKTQTSAKSVFKYLIQTVAILRLDHFYLVWIWLDKFSLESRVDLSIYLINLIVFSD